MRLTDLLEYPKLHKLLLEPLRFLRARRGGAAEGYFDLKLRGGQTLRLRRGTRDFHVFHRIFVKDEYRIGRLGDERLERVIDVGAHIGLFALRLAPLCEKLLCFEPASENRTLLLHNLAACGLETKVLVSSQAVHSHPGVFKLSKRTDPYDYTLLETAGSSAVEAVEGTTLARIFERHQIARCDLLKLDCEGSEYSILYNAPAEVLRRCERIVLELHPWAQDPQERSAPLKEHLESKGFTVEASGDPRRGHKGYLFCRR